MAQLRQDYKHFTDREVEILVVGPDSQSSFIDYWTKNELPFTGLPDPDHKVSKLYGQKVKFSRLGRMPAMMLIDKKGLLRFYHYADSMMDIPPNQSVLELIDQLIQEDKAAQQQVSQEKPE